MKSEYIHGRGYTARDSRGRVIAHSLTRIQRDDLLTYESAGVLGAALLAAICGG